jgi:predicted phosphodiesterase
MYNDSKVPLRLIGDVHGEVEKYLDLIEFASHSVQLGDFGFDRHYQRLPADFDYVSHKFIPGNHDDYDHLPLHTIDDDYGWRMLNWVPFFFIRGAFSVDYMYRTPKVSWWEQEQMDWETGKRCIANFERVRPNLVLSHDCPMQCLLAGVLTNDKKANPSTTTEILTNCFMAHKPKLWIFGHHHQDWTEEIDGTRFICLNELSTFDIWPDKNIMVHNGEYVGDFKDV